MVGINLNTFIHWSFLTISKEAGAVNGMCNKGQETRDTRGEILLNQSSHANMDSIHPWKDI